MTSKALHSDQVISSCHNGHPDVVILHSLLPGLNTAALLRRLVQRGCTNNIILFGTWTSDTVAAAQRLDVRGLIDEREDAENFVRAAHLVQGGARYYSERISGLLAIGDTQSPLSASAIASVLTPTELQILRALGKN